MRSPLTIQNMFWGVLYQCIYHLVDLDISSDMIEEII